MALPFLPALRDPGLSYYSSVAVPQCELYMLYSSAMPMHYNRVHKMMAAVHLSAKTGQ